MTFDKIKTGDLLLHVSYTTFFIDKKADEALVIRYGKLSNNLRVIKMTRRKWDRQIQQFGTARKKLHIASDKRKFIDYVFTLEFVG